MFTKFFSPPSNFSGGWGYGAKVSLRAFSVWSVLFICVFFSRSSDGSRRNWRTSWGTTSKLWVRINKVHCLSFTSSPVHHSIQVGTSTPGITGYFEVEVGGQVVHSKKVTWNCSFSLFMHGISLLKLLVWLDWLVCFDYTHLHAEWWRFCRHQGKTGQSCSGCQSQACLSCYISSYNQVSLAMKLVPNWEDETVYYSLFIVFLVWQLT